MARYVMANRRAGKFLEGQKRASREALDRFAQRAVNEETLAAEFAVFAARDTLGEASPSLAVLWAAVSMRAYAQERVWFPGDGGPTVKDLKIGRAHV